MTENDCYCEEINQIFITWCDYLCIYLFIHPLNAWGVTQTAGSSSSCAVIDHGQ